MSIPPRTQGTLKFQLERFPIGRVLLAAQRYVNTEQNSGILLLVVTGLTLAWANSPWRADYFGLLGVKLTIALGDLSFSKDLQHWVNDGLMAVFFFVVGLEIKRELTHGELSDRRRATLPFVAAIGGMAVPALLYASLNLGGSGASGWGIPMATDIAFALGVLALVGRSVPTSLRLFLLALAVIDDIGAVMVIALFYTSQISLGAIAVALALLAAIYLLQRTGLQDILAYVLLGVAFWLAIYQSGIHSTIAGVILGLLAPSRPVLGTAEFRKMSASLHGAYDRAIGRNDDSRAEAILGELEEITARTEAPVDRLERMVHPWASYVILPLFAFVNVGVELSGAALGGALASPIAIGAAIGLLLGKPVGVLLGTWLVVRLRLAPLPGGVNWLQLAGVGAIAGIGFTMSIFISGLAFSDTSSIDQAKMGIFAASLVSGLVGYAMLRYATRSAPIPIEASTD